MKKFKSPCLLHLLLVIFCHPVSVDISPQLPCHQTCYTYCHLTISVCHCYRHFHCHCNFHRCVIFVVYMLILLIFQCILGTSYFTNADSNLLQFAPVERGGKKQPPSLPAPMGYLHCLCLISVAISPPIYFGWRKKVGKAASLLRWAVEACHCHLRFHHHCHRHRCLHCLCLLRFEKSGKSSLPPSLLPPSFPRWAVEASPSPGTHLLAARWTVGSRLVQ